MDRRGDLLYRAPEAVRKEAWAAALLNARLRVPGSRRLFESVGWSGGRGSGELEQLVFSVPGALLPEPPSSVEVWWSTVERNQVAVVPCYVEGAALPKGLLNQRLPRASPQ